MCERFDEAALKRVLLFNNTAVIGHHGCTLVNRRIAALCDRHGMAIVRKVALYEDLSQLDPATFDLMIVNGEGTLHQSSKGARAIAASGSWAADHGLPAALVNTLYEHNDADIAGGVARFELVSARDRASQRELVQLGIPAGYGPDLSLTWHPQITTRATAEGVVYTDSTVQKADRMLFEASERQGGDYLPLKASPFGAGTASLVNLRRRARFSAKRGLIARFSAPHYRARYRNAIPAFDAFIARLASTRLIVAGRFHAACLALDLERPFCAIRSNSRKVEALLGECGLSGRLIDAAELLATPPERLVDRFGTFSQAELDIVRRFLQQACDSADALFARIATLERRTVP